MKIQIDLNKEISKKLAIYKIENNLKSKKDAIIKILEEKFE